MAADSAFMIWISNYGQVILFLTQIVFWLAVGVAAIWSTLIFRRLVNAKVSAGVPVESTAPVASAAATAAAPISVDEFVD